MFFIESCMIKKGKKSMDRTDCILSVIVPVYNVESTLRACLESILNQSYENFELILVDDGSTDSSSEMCDTYAQKDSRVNVIHIKNSGIFQARRLGVNRATGKIVTFSDADDWMDVNTFETVMQLFWQYDPDILAFTYDCGGGKIEEHLYEEGLYYGDDIKNKIIPGMMYDTTYSKRRLNPSLCCKLMKKELFTKVTESISDRVTLGEDALVTYPAVCLSDRLFICNKALYHYNINNDLSCTHTYPIERITEIKAFQNNIMRLFNEMGMLNKVKYQIENYVRSFLAVMVRDWYGIELSPILFRFPYHFISKGKKLVIYGAGNVGKSYVNELKYTCYVQVVGWADKNYDNIKEYNGINIIAPERIKEKDFDILLIAIQDEEKAKMIMTDLLNIGILEEKIVWVNPVCII